MKTHPLRRAVALLLCCQPVLWMSNVAYAQTLQQTFSAPGGGAPTVPSPVAPGDIETLRLDRGAPPMPPVPAVDETIDPDRYVCGPGDVLELNFWGAQNFKVRVAVDLEGRAFVAKVGYFLLKGKTLTEARRTMRESVARYFPRLSFDVALAEPRSFLVQVVDAVANPGSYSARAIDRVAAVLSRAGGTSANASKRRVQIQRRDGTTLQADLLLYALTGDVKHNPYVLDGDVVRVPFEELAASIGGAVNRPGRYELVRSRDLAELVELAGGLSPSATQLLPITVVRRERDDRSKQLLLDFADGRVPSAAVQNDDAVRIPSYQELTQSVMVIGAIGAAATVAAVAAGAQKPGVTGSTAPEEATATKRMPFVQGDSVRTLLERAGGISPLADLTGSYIVRDGKPVMVDLYKLLMLRDLSADRAIQLGDTLVVPFKRRNVLVEGAVFKPGEYPFNPTFGVPQYLSLAGGPNRFALPLEDVRIVTGDGEMMSYAEGMKIAPGTSLVVPERNFSRSEVVGIILGITTVVVSITTLALTYKK